ncbi:hypothetical protein BH23BAC2_BH23BAC2_07620 [soil metagenome]
MKNEERPKANKPLRKEDNLKENDLPYDPDINEDDKQALQERGINMNPRDKKFLAERDRPLDFAAKDLDIPGRDERNTTHEGTDIPDEQNFQYDESGIKKKRKLEDIPDPDDESIE